MAVCDAPFLTEFHPCTRKFERAGEQSRHCLVSSRKIVQVENQSLPSLHLCFEPLWSSSSWSPLPGLSVTLQTPQASWDVLLPAYSSLAAWVLTVNQQLDDLVSSQTLSPGSLPGTGAFMRQSSQHRGFGATIRWLGDFGQVICSLRVWVVVVGEGAGLL